MPHYNLADSYDRVHQTPIQTAANNAARPLTRLMGGREVKIDTHGKIQGDSTDKVATTAEKAGWVALLIIFNVLALIVTGFALLAKYLHDKDIRANNPPPSSGGPETATLTDEEQMAQLQKTQKQLEDNDPKQAVVKDFQTAVNGVAQQVQQLKGKQTTETTEE